MPISGRMSAQPEYRIAPIGFWDKAWWGEPRIKQESATDAPRKMVVRGVRRRVRAVGLNGGWGADGQQEGAAQAAGPVQNDDGLSLSY